jgi:uncharacterized membrane protein YagU involved in acid resistance
MNATRAVAAGLIGTATMTALLLIEPSVGLPNIAIGQILSSALGLSAYLPTGAAIGWGIHFVVGATFALVYAGVFVRRLPGSPFMRGVLYGGLIFVLAQLIFMPLVGGGVFSRGDVQMIAGSLLGHMVYGGVVGWIYSLHGDGTGP